MIQPDFNMLLWIIFILYIINAMCNIVLGLLKTEKNKYYGVWDILNGIITLVLLAWVVI